MRKRQIDLRNEVYPANPSPSAHLRAPCRCLRRNRSELQGRPVRLASGRLEVKGPQGKACLSPVLR
eukprot:2222616-Pyramimonas_sp.AAC.1